MVDLASVARAVIGSSLGVQSGERVWVHGWDHTVDLMSQLAMECGRAGAEVLLTVEPEELWIHSLLSSPPESLEKLSSYQSSLLEETDVYIFTLGPRRPVPWEKIPLERRKAASIWLDTRYDRSAFASEWSAVTKRKGIRMLGVEATLATPERAEDVGLDYERWREAMYSGCLEDPASALARAKVLTGRLAGDDNVHVTSPQGTALTLRLDRRPLDLSDGLATKEKANEGQITFLPAGSIEVTVDEDSANGTLVFDQPVQTSEGSIAGLNAQVDAGRITSFSVTGPRKPFRKYLEADDNAGRLSFFGVGLNSKMRFGFTQDDKVLGGVVIGFGDNEKKGGRNRANGKELWGAISKATVRIGSETVMRNGVLGA
ncbi:MAG: hypothetical protein E6K96_05835 [Thaumarchaeota archaeon]|nr:MAG: hypothetical protein E6K96_05835 [Nitrososphaerota archaeon]